MTGEEWTRYLIEKAWAAGRAVGLVRGGGEAVSPEDEWEIEEIHEDSVREEGAVARKLRLQEHLERSMGLQGRDDMLTFADKMQPKVDYINLREATDVAVYMAVRGISTKDAVENVSARFQLTASEMAIVEERVRAATEPRRVRAHSGVAIGWVRRGREGWFGTHDRWGLSPFTLPNAEAMERAVRKADNGGGW